MERRNYQLGDIVRLKKKHPCGSETWEVLRIGADLRLKCTGCGRMLMLPRPEVDKNCRELIHKEEEA